MCIRDRGITKIDPIAYDLLFERFLNPDRISLPDIDVDFDDDGRGRVLNWVTEKYGQEKVAHIITYGTMAVSYTHLAVLCFQVAFLNFGNDIGFSVFYPGIEIYDMFQYAVQNFHSVCFLLSNLS